MAITDIDPTARDLQKGQAKTAAQAAGAAAADLPEVLTEPVPVPPSLHDANLRRAARAREATVAGWLRRLSSTA
jgi:hypothetical protein